MHRGFLLDVVVGQRAAVFELFPGENKTLVSRMDSFVILDFGFYVVDSLAGLRIPRKDWILAFTLSIMSRAPTPKVIVLLVNVFAKICIQPRKRSTKCSVASFWTLWSDLTRRNLTRPSRLWLSRCRQCR